MSKSQLKSLIKECLVEVLVEGLNPSLSSVSNLKESKSSRKKRPTSSSRRPALDNIRMNNKIQESVSLATADPILGEMLADTAATTLQEQIEGSKDSRSSHRQQVAANGDDAAKIMSGADPTDVFGDAANNWAALAFNNVEK